MTFEDWFEGFLKQTPLAPTLKTLLHGKDDEIAFAVFHTIKAAWLAAEKQARPATHTHTLNNRVWGKLTAAGAEHHRGYILALHALILSKTPDFPEKYLPSLLKEGDYYKATLWEVMHIFGSGMRNGGPALFEGLTLHFEDPQREHDKWQDEALAHRESLAKLAEAFGWSDVRQENGDLHLPCAEDMIEVAREINVNDRVWAKLTQAGASQYNVHYSDWEGVSLREGDTYTGPLWETMKVFGPGLRSGGPAMFEKQLLHFGDPTPDPNPKLKVVDGGPDEA